MTTLLVRARSIAQGGSFAALAIVPLAMTTLAHANVNPVTFICTGAGWTLTGSGGALVSSGGSAPLPLSGGVIGRSGFGSATVTSTTSVQPTDFVTSSTAGALDLTFDFHGTGSGGTFTTNALIGHIQASFYNTDPVTTTWNTIINSSTSSGGFGTVSTASGFIDQDISVSVPYGQTLQNWDASVTFATTLSPGGYLYVFVPGGKSFDINLSSDTSDVGKAPEPATLGLLTVAALGMILRRRHA